MNEITTILNPSRPASDVINDLKKKSIKVPDWETLNKDYDPLKHEICSDHATRRDKQRSDGSLELAARIYVGLEELLTKRMTEFMFALPVKRVYHNIEGNETRQQIARAIEAIYKYARIDTQNIKRGMEYFASCEVASVWYTQKQKNTLYGFPCEYKLKCKTYSPMSGIKLYPLFDELDDMVAMSFQYETVIDDKTITWFETYTDTKHLKWKQESGEWQAVTIDEMSIAKIPCVYLNRNAPIYNGLSYIRKEIEYTLSRNSDVIAYNSAPILKVAGNIQGGESKGESRRVYRVEAGGDVSYVSWSQAIEALKYHIDTLFKLFWSQSQMPDISFDKMSSLGNIGFDARQTLLTDAHLKVGDESGAWIEALERECSVIKAFLKEMNKSWASEIDNVEVEHIITPFIQNDETATADRIYKLNGNKPIISQLESIQMAGYSNNPKATLEQIRKETAEETEANMAGMFNEEATR